MLAFQTLPIALHALLVTFLQPSFVAAGQQCALIAPKGYTKSSTGGSNGDSGSNGSSSSDSGPSGDGNGTVNYQPPPTTSCVRKKVSAAWYTGWHATQFPPSAVSWDKYSLVTYSFATTTGQDDPLYLSDWDQQNLPKFVSTAHANNVKASLSLGGWSGSGYFSSSVATQENRTDLVNAIMSMVSQYDLDGIDFDWEFPNNAGAGNIVSSSDTTNFLLLLEEIRATRVGKQLILSAAVGVQPWSGPQGYPLDDVSMFGWVLDFIAIMNYDIYGTNDYRGVGPNAPLNDTCASQKWGSAVSAVEAWTKAHFPAYQIALGVASYGHSYNIPPSSASAFNSSNVNYAAAVDCDAFSQRVQDNFTWDGTSGKDSCGNPQPNGGIWNFNSLVSGGYLNTNGKAAAGVDYRFDSCSRTPYVYSPATQVMVTYDDAASFTAKGNFIRDNGLLGFSMWEVGADYDDILLNSITNAMRCP